MSGIARLAGELGVSIATVSRALNGKRDVNDETRARVLAAARRLGYQPNASARSLARGATNAVGFMIELDHESAANSGNFFMGVFDGLHGTLSRHGLDLVVLPCPAGAAQQDFLERLAARNTVDAMILSATRRIDPRIPLLQERGIPFVSVGRSTSGRDSSWIDLDFEEVVRTAVARFVEKGHRRIAAAIPRGEINFVSVFHDAFRAALERHGLAFDPCLVPEVDGSEGGGYAVADPLLALPDPPTAVLLCHEMMAIGLYRRLAERGLRPGRDLAVIAMRDDPAVRFLHPALTCFTLSLHDFGRHLGEAVLAQLPRFAGQFPPGRVQTLWPMTLKPGESDGLAPRPSAPR